ncbi:MAG: hypothetical protein AAGG38_09320 [Planctomycetota bacterium]
MVCALLGFFGLVVLLAVFGHRQKKKRRDALAAWAAAQGLSFTPDKDHGFDDRFPAFRSLQRGRNRYAFNLVQGDFEGRQLYAFDYHYETTSRSTDSKGRTQTRTRHHTFSAVILTPNLTLRPMLIRPEGFGDRIAGFFGKNDLDFESAQFSRRYHVSSPDRRFAYDVLHQRAIQRLLDAPNHTLEFSPHHVLATRRKRRLKPTELLETVRLVDGILDDLPDYLRQQLREADAWQD